MCSGQCHKEAIKLCCNTYIIAVLLLALLYKLIFEQLKVNVNLIKQLLVVISDTQGVHTKVFNIHNKPFSVTQRVTTIDWLNNI
jgi:hypothetical protein